MKAQVEQCKNCKNDFTIESDDFNFYEKIKVSPPTFCPECRQMRRMSFRNERNLFKRKCDKTGKDIISVHTPTSKYTIYDFNYWYSDKFDGMIYAKDYDFSRPFFEQFNEFLLKVPLPSVRNRATENCDYNNDVSDSKNCYLCSRTHHSKDVLYGYRVNKSSDCVDCIQAVKASEFLYECIECVSCKYSSYLYFCENSAYSKFLYNCKNCIDCFMCSNLRNKQYCFMNIQLSKQEYEEKISNFNSGSYKEKEKIIKEFEDFNKNSIRRNLYIINSDNVRGDNIVNCKNIYKGFGTKLIENGRYVWDAINGRDIMDCYSGASDSELLYECTATTDSYNVHFSTQVNNSRDSDYIIFSYGCKNCFACIGITNKEFCIFNKQYTEEEYKNLMEKITEHMKQTGEHGQFFPMELSTFPYNNTVAQEYFPKTKNEVLSMGLRWNDPDTKSYTITLNPEELADDIKDTEESILKETIGCAHAGTCSHGCTTAFRIISRELDFYKRMNISLPRLCPNCRHYGRLEKLNPPKLWPGKCQCAGLGSENGIYKNLANHHLHGNEHCPNEFETSYAPNRPEIVYCEKCYQQEVY